MLKYRLLTQGLELVRNGEMPPFQVEPPHVVIWGIRIFRHLDYYDGVFRYIEAFAWTVVD